jgi:hypothetical protein
MSGARRNAGKRGTLGVFVLLLSHAVAGGPPSDSVSRKGWFADEKCSTQRVQNGRTGPPGQACTQECIRKGVKVVFIDEQTGKLYRVDNPKPTRGLESDYVEMSGMMNAETKTVHVDSIRVLEKYVAKCAVE